jgi:hypothetical protein
MEKLMLGLTGLTPERLMVWITAVDLTLIAGLAVIVLLSGRVRSRALAAQRATLERLRGGLAELVTDAEQRAQELERSLGAREERLRALLDEINRTETARAESVARAQPRPSPRPSRPATVEDVPAARQTAFDPAEDRLLRDLSAAQGAADQRAIRMDRRPAPRR